MKQDSDPRIFFAAERTLLAWLRTGIASIGLGFLVARFGYFLMMVNARAPHAHYLSTLIGIGLVVIGTAMIASAALQHRQFLGTLQADSLPQRYATWLSLMLSGLMVVSGIALALYLAFASRAAEQRSEPEPAIPRQVSRGTECVGTGRA